MSCISERGEYLAMGGKPRACNYRTILQKIPIQHDSTGHLMWQE